MATWRESLRPSLAGLSVYDVPPVENRILLHANECPEPWPESVRQRLGEVVANLDLNRYPDTSGRRLRGLLAQRYSVDASRILLGNGSDEIISILTIAFSGRDSSAVVIPTPTFVMYTHSARLFGMEVREVALDQEFQLDAEEMRRACRGSSLCFLARPNNPTSSLWDAELIHELMESNPNTIFVVDEAYGAYAPGTSMWNPQGPENFVYMNTMSKRGLAGLRLGYGIASPELATELNKVRPPYNLSLTSLAVAETIFEEFSSIQEQLLFQVRENRVRLCAILEKIPEAQVFPAYGNMALVRLSPGFRATQLSTELRQHGILVKDVSGQPGLDGCLRISVGTRDHLRELESILPKLGTVSK